MALQLRPYQQECVDHAIARNTIVNLPTGFGKTLIAARLVDHYLKLLHSKKVAFLVPTRPLVEQQAEYLVKNSTTAAGDAPFARQLIGQDQNDWKEADWSHCVRTSHILVGTAAIFAKAFVTEKYLHLEDFSLIVFDECHNACSNSPMATVMRDAVAPHMNCGRDGPRILGLTASFINGALRNPETKRKKLEALLLSTIICPNVEKRIAADSFKYVSFMRNAGLDGQKQVISTHVEKAVKNVGNIKDMEKVVSRCTHVFEELGLDALFFYIDKVIVQQIHDKARLSLEDENDSARTKYGRRMLDGLEALRKELDALAIKLQTEPLVRAAAPKSLKLEKLIELVEQLFATNDDGHRGIVFCEQVALVSSLSKQLDEALAMHGIRSGAVAGSGYQNERDRKEQLDKFKTGAIQVLVATATLEEGIEVSECVFVIRYTYVATTKAHIQGAGRARHTKAQIFYFENDPEIERRKEASMNATAKNTALSLSELELKDSVVSMNVSVALKHPFPFPLPGETETVQESEGQVTVFSCKQIFNTYCSVVLGSPITPKKDLYRYANVSGDRKILVNIRFPTPRGWKYILGEDYKRFWVGVDLDLVFSSDRSKRKTGPEREEMCFVYLVVVKLRQSGLLDGHNGAPRALRFETARACPLSSEWSDAIAIKNSVFQSSYECDRPYLVEHGAASFVSSISPPNLSM